MSDRVQQRGGWEVVGPPCRRKNIYIDQFPKHVNWKSIAYHDVQCEAKLLVRTIMLFCCWFLVSAPNPREMMTCTSWGMHIPSLHTIWLYPLKQGFKADTFPTPLFGVRCVHDQVIFTGSRSELESRNHWMLQESGSHPTSSKLMTTANYIRTNNKQDHNKNKLIGQRQLRIQQDDPIANWAKSSVNRS